VWYVSPLRRTSFYWGGGPTGSVSSSSTESRTEGSPYRYESSTSGWGLGFTSVLGVEWYVARSISLLAEYSSDLRYDHRKQTSTQSRTDDPLYDRRRESTHDTYGFTSTEVKLGVAVYF
jgi:opacity protein-like surface antigen